MTRNQTIHRMAMPDGTWARSAAEPVLESAYEFVTVLVEMPGGGFAEETVYQALTPPVEQDAAVEAEAAGQGDAEEGKADAPAS